MTVYIGTYARADAKGIYRLRLDADSGALTGLGSDEAGANPSFVALHPNGRFLYAVNESDEVGPEKGGWVSAYAVDPGTGALTFLNRQPSQGGAPCHVSVDASGKVVMAANYSSGSVIAFPVAADGKLGAASAFVQHRGSGPDQSRQEGPHAHSIYSDPSGQYALAADLGIDKVIVYKLDTATGKLRPHAEASVPPAGGPRHIALGRGGRFAYVNNEMGNSITAFAYDSRAGKLTPIQTVSTLPEGFHGSNTTAEIEVHPSGRFVYCSNRGHDSIAAYTVDESSGRLRMNGITPTGGKTPRGFGIDPTGRWLLAANQDSGNVVVFRIDSVTGALTPTGNSVRVPAPVCVVFSTS